MRDIKTELQKEIKRRRNKLNLTGAELAELADTPGGAIGISDIETKDRHWGSFMVIWRLLRFLKINALDFLRRKKKS